MKFSSHFRIAFVVWTVLGATATIASSALAQSSPGRDLVLEGAQAMGGLQRLRSLDNFVMTGFGQALNQEGGSRVTGHPMAPAKWQSVRASERTFDLASKRALNRDRRAYEFPYAATFGQSWSESNQLQTGIAMLDHPLPAVLEALDPQTQFGAVRVEDGLSVVEFTTQSGDTLWMALDPATDLPAWVRWVSPSSALGDVTNTTWFTGYLPFDGIQLPIGLTSTIDWRDTVSGEFHVDGYRLDVDDLPQFPSGGAGGFAGGGSPQAQVAGIADGLWDVRVGGNGGAVVEFDDHLVMFEAYGSEAATLARLERANTLVPGKNVTAVIVTHHHFDHSGGLRAAVSEGLTIIAHRGNEGIFREMVERPAPTFPDSLARNPRPLDFLAVDEHLVLEDETGRIDVFHAIGHLHMANAVFAWVPEYRAFLEGDFTTYNWDWHWWGDAYLTNVEHYGLEPEINIPVHGIVTSFDEAIASIEEQAARARDFCAQRAELTVYPAGCPVKFTR